MLEDSCHFTKRHIVVAFSSYPLAVRSVNRPIYRRKIQTFACSTMLLVLRDS